MITFQITKRCVKCGACESECPNDAIKEKAEQFEIDRRKCRNCGCCIDICPNGAIEENTIVLKETIHG